MITEGLICTRRPHAKAVGKINVLPIIKTFYAFCVSILFAHSPAINVSKICYYAVFDEINGRTVIMKTNIVYAIQNILSGQFLVLRAQKQGILCTFQAVVQNLVTQK